MGTRSFLGGLAVGAGLGYFLDPVCGSERRRRAGERVAAWREGSTGAVAPVRYGSRLGDVAGLESASLGTARGQRLASALLAIGGGVLALYGLARRGLAGSAARTAGAALLARGWKPWPADGPGERRRVVDIQKSIHIQAPVAEVFAFWDSYESYPRFLSALREVEDLGGGRSRWAIKGPGGRAIEWEAVLTSRQPGRLIAWRSRPGAMLENAGAIRFTPERGGTRVDLRLCYQTPMGGAGRAVSQLLGADPRATLNDDLARLKAVLEGATRRAWHGQEPGA